MVLAYILFTALVTTAIVNDQPIDYTDPEKVMRYNPITDTDELMHKHNIYIDSEIYK